MDGIPETVRRKALAAGAHRWLEELPALVASLEADWSITVGRAYRDPTEAYVAEASMNCGGPPAVLKLLVPRGTDDARNEIIALRLAGGRGCARMLRHDETRRALLLERLGPSLYELGLPIGRRHEIMCAVAAQVWRPAPGCGLPTGAQKARWLADFIITTWQALDRPVPEPVVEHALACVRRRIAAHDDERAVLVHGDVHQWNTLRAPGGYALIDPDGLLAEPEYDLGIIMREDPVELLQSDPRDRARRLAARTGRDPAAIWEWGIIERLSTGLLATTIHLQPVGRDMLTAATHITTHCPGPP